MGLLSSISKTFYNVADPVLTAVAKPIATAKAIISPTKTVKQVSNEFFSQSKLKQSTQFATNVLAVGGGALLGAAGKLGTVAKVVIPTTIKGKVIAAVAAPVVIGAVVKQPEKTISAISTAPSELAQFGGDLATFGASPSVESGKQLLKESPLIAAAAGLIVAGGAVKTIAPAVGGLLQSEAIKEQTEVIKEAGGVTVFDKSGEFKTMQGDQIAPTSQVSPQIQAVSTGSVSKKRRRKVKQALSPQNISQRVNVIVSNRQTNKYKKAVILN